MIYKQAKLLSSTFKTNSIGKKILPILFQISHPFPLPFFLKTEILDPLLHYRQLVSPSVYLLAPLSRWLTLGHPFTTTTYRSSQASSLVILNVDFNPVYACLMWLSDAYI